MTKKIVLLLDLDGVFISMAGHHLRRTEDFVRSIQLLDQWVKKQRTILIATNRTPAEMQPIAYILNSLNGWWITENGGTLYNSQDERVQFVPEMQPYATIYVPALRAYLQGSSPLITIHHTSGYIRTIITSVESMTKEHYIKTVLEPFMNNFKYKELFTISLGKVISIEPKALSKRSALPLFFQKNDIHPKTDLLFFIADNDRDREIAQELTQHNAVIGAVGNSSPRFLELVKQSKNGICAPLTTQYHSSLNFLLGAFDNLIDKIS